MTKRISQLIQLYSKKSATYCWSYLNHHKNNQVRSMIFTMESDCRIIRKYFWLCFNNFCNKHNCIILNSWLHSSGDELGLLKDTEIVFYQDIEKLQKKVGNVFLETEGFAQKKIFLDSFTWFPLPLPRNVHIYTLSIGDTRSSISCSGYGKTATRTK